MSNKASGYNLHIPIPIFTGRDPKLTGVNTATFHDDIDITEMDIVHKIVKDKPKIVLVRKFFNNRIIRLNKAERDNPVFERSFTTIR